MSAISAKVPVIVEKLREHGMPPDKPVAVISKATTPQQRTVDGTLATIVERVAAAKLEAPALIVVGDVVKLGTDRIVCPTPSVLSNTR